MRRIGERTDALELDFLEKFHELREIVVRFTRETDNTGRADRQVGHSIPKACDFLADRVFALGASHPVEHTVRRVLHWHIEIAQNPRLGGDDIEQLRRDARRIQIHVTKPRNRRIGDQRLEQIRETHAVAAIAAVMREILSHQIYFAGSLQLEQLCLADDFV